MKGFGRLSLDRASDRSMQTQLAAQLKLMIQTCELDSGQRLPSTRMLAEQLQISRNTVVAAYETLLAEGYLHSQLRSGFVVGAAAEAFRSGPLRARPSGLRSAAPKLPLLPVPFRPTQPDVSLFSLKTWNRLRTRVLKQDASLLHYQSRFPIGLDSLRKCVAAYLHDSRGVNCQWDEVAITSGSQQALFLLAHMLLDSTQSVYMEDPGYKGARMAWESAKAQVIPSPVDEEGMRLPLRDAPNASLIYVTPSHQFPLGSCMTLARRLALLQIARERKLWIVEDDYDSEFRYTSHPQPSLQSLDKHRQVIYIGSFSKTLFPGLRLGYVVLPPKLVEPFRQIKAIADDHGPLIDQATLAAFLDSGALYAHLRRCRRLYAERQEFFLALIERSSLPLTFPVTGRGMNLAGILTDGVAGRVWSRRLQHAGLDVPALSTYSIEANNSGLLFGLSAFNESTIRAGVKAMSSVFSTYSAGSIH
jgi:GntR family transcriptional regulator/MocR family aminotransferase